MSIESEITADSGASDATVIGRVNADPSRFRPVTSPQGLAWIGGNARDDKLTNLAAKFIGSGNADLRKLGSAVRTFQKSLLNPGSTLDLAPGSEQRTLLDLIVGACAAQPQLAGADAITSDDAAALLAKAVTTPDVTEADVAATRAAMAAQAERDALANRAASLHAWIAEQADAPTGDEVKARWESGS